MRLCFSSREKSGMLDCGLDGVFAKGFRFRKTIVLWRNLCKVIAPNHMVSGKKYFDLSFLLEVKFEQSLVWTFQPIALERAGFKELERLRGAVSF